MGKTMAYAFGMLFLLLSMFLAACGQVPEPGGALSAEDTIASGPTLVPRQAGLTVFTGLDIHSVTTVALDPTNPEVIYAGAQVGLAKSTDGGKSWRVVNADQQWPSAIVIDPQNSQVLYACRRALSGNRGSALPGIYKSTDGGNSWVTKGEGTGGEGIFSLALDPNAPVVLYAGAQDGLVFKSTDAGESWALAGDERPALEGEPPRAVERLLVDPRTGELYAVENTMGTFKSSDGGWTWTTVHNASGYLVIDPRAGNLYLAGRNLWRSTDGGANWQDISGDLPRDTEIWSHQLTWVGINPDPLVLYVQWQRLSTYRSTDGGMTWTVLGMEEGFFPLAVKPGVHPELYGAAAGTVARYIESAVP